LPQSASLHRALFEAVFSSEFGRSVNWLKRKEPRIRLLGEARSFSIYTLPPPRPVGRDLRGGMAAQSLRDPESLRRFYDTRRQEKCEAE
jgi:hypothetical protein